MSPALELLNWFSHDAPLLLLFILANGILTPVLYAALKKLPFNLSIVRQNMKEGDIWATYAWYSWLLFSVFSGGVLLLVLSAAIVNP